MKLNAKGMTIIEVMLGIVLFSFVALGVTFFISTATKTCNHAEDTIRIQEEAQVVMNQLVSITMEGNSASAPLAERNGDVKFFVYKTDKVSKVTNTEYIFYYQKSSQNLYYYEVTERTTSEESDAVISEINGISSDIVYGQLMGRYITDFQVGVSNNCVSFKAQYELNGKKIESQDTVFMRNKRVRAVSPLI